MASDLSFNIVALDRASATFVKVAEQLDKISAKVDRLDGKSANVNVNVKTDESTKALDSFTNRWALLASGIIAGSPALGAAIVGGVGAGFIGIAALAQKSNKDVQQTYTTLWQNVVTDTKQATNGLVPVIVDAGNQIGHTFTALGPLMSAGFAAAGPEIVALTNGVTGFAQNAMPGLISMVQRSQPVFTGLETAAETLGTAAGHAFQEIGDHSQATGAFLVSFGNIAGTVLGLAVRLMNDVAQVWAQNGAEISSAIQGIANVASGLASGAMPVLSAALGAAAQIVTTLAAVLSPLSGTLGFVATAALATWAAFKGASLISDGVRAAASAIVGLGGNIEAGASKAATFMAAQQGVAVESSAMASATRAAGAATASASLSFATTAETLAGPLGIALAAVTIGLALFASSSGDATQHTQNLKTAQDSLVSALEQSKGAITGQVISTLTSQQAFKDAADGAKQFGVSQQQMIDAVLQGGPALDELKKKLQDIIAANTQTTTVAGGSQVKSMNDLGKAANTTLMSLNDLNNTFKGSVEQQQKNAQAVQQHTSAILDSKDAFLGINGAAQSAGVGFSFVSDKIVALGNASKDTNFTIQDLLETFGKQSLATANAGGQIASTFTQADKQVTQAAAGVASAQHGVAQASQAVADAHHGEAQAAQQVVQAQQGVVAAAHGVEQAKRSVQDAIRGVTDAQHSEQQAEIALADATRGVTDAQYQYNQALRSEKDAEKALSDARQQAVRDIQAVHDALNNAQTSQANARLSLFNAQQTAAGQGVTDKNVQQLAYSTPITTTNQAQIKAAVDLISAQNQLAQSTAAAANAKQDAAKADQAGVNGAQNVVSAQRSLIDSQRGVQQAQLGVQQATQAVTNASYSLTQAHLGVTRAQQAVRDASFGLTQAQQGLQRAHQAVTDAGYAQQKAHQAVRDAEYQETAASQQLSTAQANLRDAHDNASRALDINTEAGRRNLGQLYALADAIKTQFGPNQVGWTKLVDDTARAFGWSTDQAAGYLKQLNLIDPNYKYSVTGVAQVDMTPLYDFMKDPDNQGSGGYFANAFRSAGGPLGYADGGSITGPGGPRDDLVHIMASPGEYMQPADVVDYYGVDTMEAMRKKKLPRFAKGGFVQQTVDANVFGLGAGAGYLMKRNAAIVAGADPGRIPNIPKWTPPPVASFGGVGSVSGIRGDRAANRAIVLNTFASMFGWSSPSEVAATDYLMMRESGYNNVAQNPTSTAYGMFQFLNSTWGGYGIPKTSDPTQQSIAGGRYISARYGDPIGASAHERAFNWYRDGGLVKTMGRMNKAGSFDNGGQLQPGWTPVYNGTNKPESVRTSTQEDALLKALQSVKSSIDGLARREFNGTLRTSSGAFLGEVKAAFDELTTQAGL